MKFQEICGMMTLDDFVALSLEVIQAGDAITVFDLYGTGNVETFHELYRDHADQDPSRKALIRLWYLGEWTPPGSAEVHITRESFSNALVWKAIGAAAQGTRPPGYGAWSFRPPRISGGRRRAVASSREPSPNSPRQSSRFT